MLYDKAPVIKLYYVYDMERGLALSRYDLFPVKSEIAIIPINTKIKSFKKVAENLYTVKCNCGMSLYIPTSAESML